MTEAAMAEKSNDETKKNPAKDAPAPAEDAEASPTGVAPAADGTVPAVPPRRQLGVKEPIIFKWKLLGGAGDVMLTLFKSTEREDVDAQFERVQREGYYTNLKIVEADAKVPQSKKAKDTLDKERKLMGSVAEKKAREEKSPRSKEILAEPKLIRLGRTKAAIARAEAAAAKKAAKKTVKKKKTTKKATKKAAKTKKAATTTKKKAKKAAKKAPKKAPAKKTVKKKAKAKKAPAKKTKKTAAKKRGKR